MPPQTVRNELSSPLVAMAVLLTLANIAYGIFLQSLRIVWPLISLMGTLYLIYLFIRLVLAVEEIAYE